MLRPRGRLFVPILAGATLRERVIACAGALIGIAVTGLVCALLTGGGAHQILIVAPMGASAVLLFAVPASPMAQPWPVIGGNTISALVGIGVAHLIDGPALAIGTGVSLAIIVMSLTRCLHPPGGAAALTAVLGGPVVGAAGWLFPLVPVGINSLLLVGLGVAFHRATGRTYPHRPAPASPNVHSTLDPAPQLRGGFRAEDIDAALRALHETFDVDRDDVARLLRAVELQAAARASGGLRCSDIMSRDVITAAPGDPVEHVRSLLLTHRLRIVPVVDETGLVLGSVGLRELCDGVGPIAKFVTPAATAALEDAALGLLPTLTDGAAHAVVVVDAERKVRGLVTQTDLLVAMMQTLARRA